ncbi:MAG: response regulator [Treponema sp.]|jgi:signal transduction histidine kinase/CheY-like chemotaxis protein|nr:response regulator [Treponema sp.]
MSIRIKVLLIIISIVVLLTASSMAVGIYVNRASLLRTIESDMEVVSKIAVKLVTTNIGLIKMRADTVAGDILEEAIEAARAGRSFSGRHLEASLQAHALDNGYLALTVIGSRGIEASYGMFPPDESFVHSVYALRAFSGEQTITTTELVNGTLVIRVCIPMGTRILTATLPGETISNIVSEFRIWQTGNIFILDEEGTFLANMRPPLVLERRNFIRESLESLAVRPETGDIAPVYKKMIQGHSGTDIYVYENYPRVCAYVPVPGSGGWSLGVIAVIRESPSGHVRSLIFSALVFLGLGILVAFFAADVVAKPFRQLKEQSCHLEELRIVAENASRAKGEFLSNMSHEMRTPMNAIIGMTAIAKTSPDMERKDYCLSKIEDASVHLLAVINDILDMSKIEANKLELSLNVFSFEKMLQRVVNVVNFRVEEKHQHFTVSIDQNIPPYIEGDEQRLAQVITNLLSNAVKFTPEGGTIKLETRAAGMAAGRCIIQIAVIDTGIGISGEQKARLFTSFQQADSSISRKFGGTGLGLAISKRIVEMMGGTIWVQSEEGAGSTFAFTIQAKAGLEPEQNRPGPGINKSSVRILAVDDEKDIRDYFAELAGNMGISCDTASSGEEAIQLTGQNGPYDIYFIDWKMPGMNGIELSRRIKSETAPDRTAAANPSGPVVIMISGTDWNRIASDAKEAGVDKFLPKPLFPSAIADCISECLNAGNIQPAQAVEPAVNADCFRGRHILIAEDVDINREIVAALLETTGIGVDFAENGVEAVRLCSEDLKLEKPRYEMVFMDIQMPEMDGFEATRRIRAVEASLRSVALTPPRRELPVIAMTANVFREDVEKCLAAGMNGHVGKPLDLGEVLAALRKYL